MVCIYCGRDTEVTNSRSRARNPSVWRRRACKACVAQFTTIELPDYATALVVKGRDNKLYPFSRDKLFLSLHKALSHRPDAIISSTELSTSVIGKLLKTKKAPDGLITSRSLSKVSYETLKRYDPSAAHTYKAYHQQTLSKN